MTVYIESHHGDGTSTIVDSADKRRFTVKQADWPAIARLPNEEQRAKLVEVEIKQGSKPK